MEANAARGLGGGAAGVTYKADTLVDLFSPRKLRYRGTQREQKRTSLIPLTSRQNERSKSSEDVMISVKAVYASAAMAVLISVAAMAQSTTTGAQDQPAQNQMNLEDMKAKGAIGPTQPRSGPGVQGPPDTRTGPSTRSPGDSAAGDDKSGSAATGQSAGDTGAAAGTEHKTKPSQDATGVQGYPNTRTGPNMHDGNPASSGGSTGAGSTVP